METGHDFVDWVLKTNGYGSQCFRLIGGLIELWNEMEPSYRPSCGWNIWGGSPGLTNASKNNGEQLLRKMSPNQGRESIRGQSLGGGKTFKFQLHIRLSEWQGPN